MKSLVYPSSTSYLGGRDESIIVQGKSRQNISETPTQQTGCGERE
jgi:hypothetical protein